MYGSAIYTWLTNIFYSRGPRDHKAGAEACQKLKLDRG